MREDAGFMRSANMLFAVTFLFWCSQYSYTQFVNPELKLLGAGASFMGLVAGAYGLAQTLLRIPLGIAADRLGRQKPFILLGTLLPVLACALLLAFYTPAGFFAMRLLSGAASASWVSFTVLYSSYFRPQDAPGRISFLNLANMLGKLAGFVVILLLVPAFSVKSSFVFSMAAAGAALLLAVPLREAPGARAGLTLRELLAVSKDRNLLACSAVGALAQAFSFATIYGFTVNAAMALRAGSAEVTWLNIALMVPGVLTNFFVPRLLRRVKAVTLVSAGCFLCALYACLVPFAANLPQMYLMQGLGGVGSTLSFSVLLGLSIRDVPRERRAAAMGFYQAAYGVGMTLGPVIMGAVIDASELKIAFLLAGALSLATGCAALALLNRTSVLSEDSR